MHSYKDLEEGSDHPCFSARVGGEFISYAKGRRESVLVHDPSSPVYVPKSRFAHCAALVGAKWYVLGGEGRQGCPFSAIEEYDINRQRWQQHEAQGAIPLASFGVACAALEGKLYMFGGRKSESNTYFNVLSKLDLDSMIWKTLEPGDLRHAPMQKKGAAMSTCGRCLVTFGGYGTLHEHMSKSRATYDQSGRRSEMWTNELICYDLDKCKHWYITGAQLCYALL